MGNVSKKGVPMNYNILDQASDAFIIIELSNNSPVYMNKKAEQLFIMIDEHNESGGTYIDMNHYQLMILENLQAQYSAESPVLNIPMYTKLVGTQIFNVDISANYTHPSMDHLCIKISFVAVAACSEMTSSVISDIVLAGIAIISSDESMSIQYANPAFYEIFEISQCECASNHNYSFVDVIHPHDRMGILKNYLTQCEKEQSFVCEMRILTKCSGVKWISLSGAIRKNTAGVAEAYCSVTDINHQKKLVNKLKSEQRFYNIIKNISNDIIFRLDLITNTIDYSGHGLTNFGLTGTVESFPQLFLENAIILEEDLPVFLKMVDNMKNGVKESHSFRMVNLIGEHQWYRIDYEPMYDEYSNIYEVVGRFINIQKEKLLEEEASTDSLTKCVNKMKTQSLIDHTLATSQPSDEHTFIIVDIDGFKSVNDNLGHHFGDLVLSEVAARLLSLFHTSNFVGRIGGDEFVVFLRNTSDMDQLLAHINNISSTFQNTYRDGDKSYTITASIGVSKYPSDGTSFEPLYKNADTALYHSKMKGKNCYSFYHLSMGQGTMTNTTPFETAQRLLTQQYDNKLINTVFDMLYDTSNMSSSINNILAIVGSGLNVDRSYIFETIDGGTYFDNTYEWCRSGIAPEIDSLQGIHKDVWKAIFGRANSEGVFYSNNLSEMVSEPMFELLHRQGIKSLLHCLLSVNGVVQVSIGFDDCTKTRIWSGKEIATLMHISKILGIFLNRERTKKNDIYYHNMRDELLDNTDSYGYVIDQKDHKLLFLNRKTMALLPHAKVGDYCYKVIRGCDAICSDCPIKDLSTENPLITRELDNETCHLKLLTSAAKIKWDNNLDAVLMHSVDITNYKNN